VLVLEWFAALRASTIVVVALELIAIELVNRVPLPSHVFSRVTLGIVISMMETSLP